MFKHLILGWLHGSHKFWLGDFEDPKTILKGINSIYSSESILKYSSSIVT